MHTSFPPSLHFHRAIYSPRLFRGLLSCPPEPRGWLRTRARRPRKTGTLGQAPSKLDAGPPTILIRIDELRMNQDHLSRKICPPGRCVSPGGRIRSVYIAPPRWSSRVPANPHRGSTAPDTPASGASLLPARAARLPSKGFRPPVLIPHTGPPKLTGHSRGSSVPNPNTYVVWVLLGVAQDAIQ